MKTVENHSKKIQYIFPLYAKKFVITSSESINTEGVKTVFFTEEDKKIVEICDEECMLKLLEEAKNAKIENPWNIVLLQRCCECSSRNKSKQKIVNNFYLSSTEDTSYVINPTKKIFQDELYLTSNGSKKYGTVIWRNKICTGYYYVKNHITRS